MNSGKTYLSTCANGLEVASNYRSNKEQWIKLPRSCTTSDLPTDAKELATKEKVRKWKYLDSTHKKICQDDNIKIQTLIGANYSKALEPIGLSQKEDPIFSEQS